MKRVALIAVAAISLMGAALPLIWHQTTPGRPKGDLAPRAEVLPIVSGSIIAYLIVKPTAPLVLINLGDDPSAQAILDRIQRLRRKPSEVRAIVVNHGSYDHNSGARHFPNATVYASSKDLELLDHVRQIRAPLPRLRMRVLGRPERPRRLRTVVSSERLTIGAIELEAVAIPGVTHGSMAYRFGDTLFVGDTLWRRDDTLAPPPSYWLEDAEALEATLARLNTLPTGWVATSRFGFVQRGRTPITAGNGRRIDPVPASKTSVPEPY